MHDTSLGAAILAGVSPFDMTPEELEKVADKLRAQRPLLSAYTTDMTSIKQALATGLVAACRCFIVVLHGVPGGRRMASRE